VNNGPALVIDADGNVVDATGPSQINGAALLVTSPLNPPVVYTPSATNGLCMSGSVGPVLPDTMGGDDYTNYWGAEIDLDLNRVANPDAVDAGAGDAGAGDAGTALGQVARAWDPADGNVIGFSFTITGPTIPVSVRFKTAPTGSDTASDNFCKQMSPVSGATQNVLFTEFTRDCWTPGGPAVFADPDGYTTLQNIGWQVNADPLIAYAFDFCINDIRPILAP
jgi:hypothetical protein